MRAETEEEEEATAREDVRTLSSNYLYPPVKIKVGRVVYQAAKVESLKLSAVYVQIFHNNQSAEEDDGARGRRSGGRRPGARDRVHEDSARHGQDNDSDCQAQNQDAEKMPPWRNRPRGPYPGGPPDGPGPGAAGPQWSGRPNPRGGRPGRRQHRGWPNGGAGQRRPGSAGTASPAAGRPTRHGAGPSAATSRHQAGPSATEPPHHGAGPSTTGGPAWSRPPCHTVATWTAWEEGGAVHFVYRRRWKHQPRPTPGQPDHQVPLPFRGHTQPAAPRVLGAPDTCWLCGVPIIHLETHEAGRLHSDLLEAQPLPDNVAAAVQTLRASRPDLLAPAALASVQPARPSRKPCRRTGCRSCCYQTRHHDGPHNIGRHHILRPKPSGQCRPPAPFVPLDFRRRHHGRGGTTPRPKPVSTRGPPKTGP
ncbi:transcription initiation factor TFIID subunit 4-like [Ixodes scapularis]